ncbi:DegT/DnrJ/EryC1/StrS aminotransferase family protein [Janthinobacterium sp.]|uniref:DegT/DnrJ/EryC1/StrS family aminotransferase n=1 Tax=Janthinobacterium sp. TaxID=1871054 RepID=UPI002DB847F2|nr:DegT/DnrJ/EryC1/StrS aminotransferase family protein [Janthinobacterium sp.]HEU4819215.1 DegT/DnrJ/EryC1/StrS aminotransferase family protein [Janthinobacterium sp.]
MNSTLPSPAAWPVYPEDEISVVTEILRSGKVNYWTGDVGRAFEREYAAYVGSKHAIAVANGTVALELALYALGVGAGDEVITTSRTYIASASCAVMRGAVPVIVDVDRDTQNISPAAIRAAITPRTRAILVVHLAGWPCDMDPIMALAEEFNLKVIEDCAQAHGATYKGRQVGSIGHAAAFSFCQDKIISTGGEGGMMTTSDNAAWEKAWAYKDIGRSYDAVYRREHPPGFRWLTETFGTNWRLTEVQSAIGRLQLAKLNDWIAVRKQHSEFLSQLFSAIPALRLTLPPPEVGHAYYKYYVFVKPECLAPGWSRDRIMAELNAAGVPCFSGSCSEIHREKAFESLPAREVHTPVAHELGETSLMFLVHPTLTTEYMQAVGKVLQEVLAQASR